MKGYKYYTSPYLCLARELSLMLGAKHVHKLKETADKTYSIRYSNVTIKSSKNWSYNRAVLELVLKCIVGACKMWSLKRGGLPREWSPKTGTTII